MKKLSVLTAVAGMAFFGAANAANVTLYYSPTCPHCHHAREFINNTLVYEYPNFTVSEVNVMSQENMNAFESALSKCKYDNGGVPVIVIGEKCFQGYADFMQDDLRAAVAVDLSDADKALAEENKKAMAEDAEKFKSEHSDRASAISEYKPGADNAQQAPAAAEESAVAATEQPAGESPWVFYGILIALVAALGFVLIRKKK